MATTMRESRLRVHIKGIGNVHRSHQKNFPSRIYPREIIK